MEWKDRKEFTQKESHFGIPGTDYYKTVLYDNKGRRAEGLGKTEDESREKAYKKWDEKYR